MQHLSKHDLYKTLILKDYMLPYLGKGITKHHMLYILNHPLSCLKKEGWLICLFKVRCGKDYLYAQIHRYHETILNERCWINSIKHSTKGYLLSYLYSLCPTDTIFTDHLSVRKKRNLKKQRKLIVRPRRNIIPPIMGNYRKQALDLFNTHDQYFVIPPSINESFWNETRLYDDKSRFKTIQILNQMHRLIKLLN